MRAAESRSHKGVLVMLPWIEQYEYALEELEVYYQLGGYNQDRTDVYRSFAVAILTIVF